MAKVLEFSISTSPSNEYSELISSRMDWLDDIAGRKPILTSGWNGFFDLLFVAFVIIIIQDELPQRILPLCLTFKVTLCRTLSTCGLQEGRCQGEASGTGAAGLVSGGLL